MHVAKHAERLRGDRGGELAPTIAGVPVFLHFRRDLLVNHSLFERLRDQIHVVIKRTRRQGPQKLVSLLACASGVLRLEDLVDESFQAELMLHLVGDAERARVLSDGARVVSSRSFVLCGHVRERGEQ